MALSTRDTLKRRAQRVRTRCLMFLLQDDAPWPLTWVDAGSAGAHGGFLYVRKDCLIRTIDKIITF